LNSSKGTPFSIRKRPAGDVFLIAPAGEVVGRHRVAEDAERARALDLRDRAGRHREAREERRLLDVGRLRLELVNVARGRRDFVPLRILRREVGVELAENLRLQRRLQLVAHFAQRRPDVLQKNVLAVLVVAERIFREIDVDAAGKCERDDERRRH
jgi:hypothetical protein